MTADSERRTYLITDDDYYLTPSAVVVCSEDEAKTLLARLGERHYLVLMQTVSPEATLSEVEHASAQVSGVMRS